MGEKIIIAIDGYSSCGKSTMAKTLSKKIGYLYIDSGAMYRAITFYCIENNYIKGKELKQDLLKEDIKNNKIHISFVLNKKTSNSDTYLNNINIESTIRSLEVSNLVSYVSSLKFVRDFLVARQRELGKEKGIVMDGRDIGTSVFPEAELKFFVTAEASIRAKRRYDELIKKGDNVSFEAVLKNIEDRDFMDENRSESPLKKAEDAVVLDNSSLSIKEQESFLLTHFYDKIKSK